MSFASRLAERSEPDCSVDRYISSLTWLGLGLGLGFGLRLGFGFGFGFAFGFGSALTLKA